MISKRPVLARSTPPGDRISACSEAAAKEQSREDQAESAALHQARADQQAADEDRRISDEKLVAAERNIEDV